MLACGIECGQTRPDWRERAALVARTEGGQGMGAFLARATGAAGAPSAQTEAAGPSAALTTPSAARAVALGEAREKFLPLTRHALIDRLAAPSLWPAGQGADARRFFRYLDFWRHQAYAARLLELEQTYEPFSPDSDLLITRKFTGDERISMQKQMVAQVRTLLTNANFTEIAADRIEILSQGSSYGLELQCDLSVFDEIAVFYRGSSSRTDTRRSARNLYMRKEEFTVPIFRRLCVLFKLKPFDVRVAEVMAQEKCERRVAEKKVRKLRSALPSGISSDFVYLKLFKNIPHTDLEMVFPNTQVKFRKFDKIKFGATAGSGVGMGIAGAVTKLAVAATPIGMVGAVAAVGGVAVRQVTTFIGQRNKYMMTLAQNLYFHAMADNRGVMTLLADRAAEEDVKEEMLLYSVLAKQTANVRDLDEIDAAIERYLKTTYGFDADFDIDDALKRLLADGIVRQLPDGTLDTLPPAQAAKHIDELWDAYLDKLPDAGPREGLEFDAVAPNR
jgi:Protein of unknown function (DUF3754)